MALKKEQVQIFEKSNQFWTTSVDVAEKFGKSHDNVLKHIRRLDCSQEFSRVNFNASNYTKRGKEYPCYDVTRDGFTFLVMGFTGKKAATWKERYIQAFNAMESRLKFQLRNQANESWQKVRQDSKPIRIEQTDVIKDFVAYAERQGSKNANKYYMAITKMENKALFYIAEGLPKPNNLRDVLDTFQLFQLGTADKVVANAIREGMDNGMHYKDIFQLAKQKIEQFAGIVGVTPIPTESMIGHNSLMAGQTALPYLVARRGLA